MAKRKAKSQISNLTLDHQKSRIDPISLYAGGVRHVIKKPSTRATTLLQFSSQYKVCTQSYGAPKSRESQLWQFRNSHLGVPGQNAIWMRASWKGTKYTIRGKVVASPQVWVVVSLVNPNCSWFVLAPKVLQLCTNHFVLVLCRSM